jgi:hypothetical protein
MPEVLSIKQALDAGLTRYFSGKPCKRGHLSERFVTNRTCAACLYEDRTAYERANPEWKRAAKRNWRKTNPDKARVADRRVSQRHAVKAAARRQAQFEADPEGIRARRRQQQRAWYDANPGSLAAHSAKRRAALRRAVPSWAELDRIAALYAEAAREGLQVDHIIPLRHPEVCGLHVMANLQKLTALENVTKNNTFISDWNL